jgi:hypothetical protein
MSNTQQVLQINLPKCQLLIWPFTFRLISQILDNTTAIFIPWVFLYSEMTCMWQEMMDPAEHNIGRTGI